MKLLDTNILLRWLLEDDKRKAEKVDKLLTKVGSKETFAVSDLALAEMVWVLESQGAYRSSISQNLMRLFSFENINFENKDRLLAGLTIYAEHPVDFIDAYHAALAQEKGIRVIYSYDQDFNKMAFIERLEP